MTFCNICNETLIDTTNHNCKRQNVINNIETLRYINSVKHKQVFGLIETILAILAKGKINDDQKTFTIDLETVSQAYQATKDEYKFSIYEHNLNSFNNQWHRLNDMFDQIHNLFTVSSTPKPDYKAKAKQIENLRLTLEYIIKLKSKKPDLNQNKLITTEEFIKLLENTEDLTKITNPN